MARSHTKSPGGKYVQKELWDNVGQITRKNPFKKKKMPASLDSSSDWNALFSQLNWYWRTKKFPTEQKGIIRDAFMELKGYDSLVVSVARARELLKRLVEDPGKYCGIGDWMSDDIVTSEQVLELAIKFMKKVVEILSRAKLTHPDLEERAISFLVGEELSEHERHLKMAQWAFKRRAEELLLGVELGSIPHPFPSQAQSIDSSPPHTQAVIS